VYSHATFASLPTEHILWLLIQEREKLNRTIEALQDPTKRRGRPPKGFGAVSAHGGAKKRKAFSAATRKKMARAQKKRWAAPKAAKVTIIRGLGSWRAAAPATSPAIRSGAACPDEL
jgi:hypothetical protein